MSKVVRINETKVFLKGHEADFTQFALFLGDKFASQLCDAFCAFQESVNLKSSVSSVKHRVFKYLDYISHSDTQKSLRDFLKYGNIPSNLYAVFANSVSGFRESLRDNKNYSNRYKDNICASVRSFLNVLADQGHFPRNIYLKGFKYDKDRIGANLLSVCEEEIEDVLESVDFDELGLEYNEQAKQFVADLLLEYSEKELKEANLIELAIKTLDLRLKIVKRGLEQIILESISKIEEGLKWSQCEEYVVKAELLDKAIRLNSSDSRLKNKLYKDALKGDSLKVIVTYLHKFCSSKFPSFTTLKYKRLSPRLSQYNLTRKDIESHISLQLKELTACYGFLLHELVGNPICVETIRYDCVERSDFGEDYKRVIWEKSRKGTSHSTEHQDIPISNKNNEELPARPLTVIDVIEHVNKCTLTLRADAAEGHEKYLFLHNYKNITKAEFNPQIRQHLASKPAGATLQKYFKKLTGEFSNGEWSANPNSLRTSLLLLTALLEKDVFAVKAKARHVTLASGRRYINHIAIVLGREAKIRDFLNWLEALVTVNIDDYPKKVGIDSETYKENIERTNSLNLSSTPVGFGGMHCKDPYSGKQEGTVAGEACHRVDQCHSCDNKTNFILASEQNFISAMHFSDALELYKRKATRADYKKWELWELFVDYVINNIANEARNRSVYKIAMAEKDKLKNPYIPIFELFE